jgi:hypothetical protein
VRDVDHRTRHPVTCVHNRLQAAPELRQVTDREGRSVLGPRASRGRPFNPKNTDHRIPSQALGQGDKWLLSRDSSAAQPARKTSALEGPEIVAGGKRAAPG